MSVKRNKVGGDVVIVVFRVFKTGDVIALFPMEPATTDGRYITSYMHIGQHSAADYHGVIGDTRPATEAEYTPLRKELESAPYGYTFQIAKRAPSWSKVKEAMRA